MMKHYSVLLQESIDNLAIHSDGIYVDGTLGRGGHSAEILARIPQGHLYAFDRDASAIEESRERLAQIGDNVTLIHSNFSNLKRELTARGVTGIDGMVLDLGVSSPQFDEAQRGCTAGYAHGSEPEAQCLSGGERVGVPGASTHLFSVW